MTTENTDLPIQGAVVGQYFAFFNGVTKAHYKQIVDTAPFDKVNLLILAFVHAIEVKGDYLAQFTNWRDNSFPLDPNDTDADRVELIVKTARAKNPNIKFLMSLGWGTNDTGNAAQTPLKFAESVQYLAQNFNLDGFDFDFEPPTEVTPAAMLNLSQVVRAHLNSIQPKRTSVMTITPAQTDGLDKSVLQSFDYTMPQTYTPPHGNGTTAKWFADTLGSYSQIVYGLDSEGYIGSSDDPAKFAAEAKSKKAAGIFAWRLDNDSVSHTTGFPTFATGIKMWQLMRGSADVAVGS